MRGRNTRVLVFLLVGAFLCACRGVEQPESHLVREGVCAPLNVTGTPVYFLTIDVEGSGTSGEESKEKPGLNLIIDGDLDTVEDVINPDTYGKLTQINYLQQFAIIVFQGKQGSTDHRVFVQQVYEQGDRLVVQACFLTPWDRGYDSAGDAETDPYTVIELDRPEHFWKEVVLMDGQEVVATVPIENP
jgi:hypothetical protein